MNERLSAVRAAMCDVLNALNDVKGDDVTDAGQDEIDEIELAVEALTRRFDASFDPQKGAVR